MALSKIDTANMIDNLNLSTGPVAGTIQNANLPDNTYKLLAETDFTSGTTHVVFDNSTFTGSGYDNIYFQCTRWTPNTDGDELIMYLSDANGSSLEDAHNGRLYIRASGSAASGAEQQDAGYARFETNPGNDANRGINVTCWMPDFNKSASSRKVGNYITTGMEQTYNYTWHGGFVTQNTVAALNYLKFSTAASGTHSGIIRIYGY